MPDRSFYLQSEDLEAMILKQIHEAGFSLLLFFFVFLPFVATHFYEKQ